MSPNEEPGDEMVRGARRPEGGRRPVVLAAGEGRSYEMGQMRAVFKADDAETGGRYSVSEWTLDPGFEGVHPHRHDDEDDVFFVLEGEVTFTVDGEEVRAGAGTYVQASAGAEHGFRNDGHEPARLLNLYVPGRFEDQMPGIVRWHEQHDT